MKIAIHSPMFLPRIGGLENVTEMLARHFGRRGHEVRVITITAADERGDKSSALYDVVRDPAGKRIWQTAGWCDVFVHSNMSLKAVLPPLCLRKPWVVIHHGWYSHPERRKNLNAIAKCQLARLASANVAVSRAVADYLGIQCEVIHNPYDDRTFKLKDGIERERDLLFAGRLVSDKAPDLLLEAASILKQQGLSPTITITGRGPEEEPLRKQVKDLGLQQQVQFTGALVGDALADVMNAHRILVVPSTIREGFGIVALEGIACGCVVAGANAGGLPEAIGPCGVLFERGNANDIAARLKEMLTGQRPVDEMIKARETHVRSHTLEAVGDAYLSIIERTTAPFQQPLPH